LVGLAQRDEVRSQVGRLRDHARLVFGDPEKVDVAGADPVQGAFLSPLLLRADDAYGAGPHQIEAFGPVSTLLPYESTAEVVELVTLGEGSLVGSVVTHDPQFACDLVLGIAPWHGRVLVLNRDDYRESTGHGIPMPQLVHGGPGRAGGGEEEGGLRAVWHHMQRTAVQGGPAMLAAIEKYTTN
jgi:oxepin-CoA hydrolase/3-oxo-5,6-dehydrosuberyl-CoA semialdehyde dehydrogenase